LKVSVRCNGHGRESGWCAQGICPKENVCGNYPGSDVWWGRSSGISFKVLLYDNLVGIVISGNVTKLAKNTGNKKKFIGTRM